MKMGYMFAVERNPYEWESYRIGFAERKPDGTVFVAEPATMKQLDRGERVEHCFVSLDDSDVVRLMDELWMAGVRPSKALAGRADPSRVDDEVKWLRETADHLMKKPTAKEK